MKKTLRTIVLCSLAVGSMAFPTHSYAQSLDNTFDTDGILTDVEGGFSRKNLVQPDGKIVLAGYSGSGNERSFIAIRYNSDGSRDNSFGTNGRVIETFGGLDARCFDAELLSDGKIVMFGNINPVLGSQERNVVVLQLNADGSLDNSFGTAGIATHSILSGNDFVSAALVQPDGKYVIVGRTRILDTFQDDGFVLRLNSDGTTDNGFGTNGMLVFDSGSQKSEILYGVSLTTDGSIIAAGTYFPGGGNPNESLLIKVTPAGQLDASFDTDGIFTANYTGGDENIYALHVDASTNDIVAAVDGSVSGTNVLVKLSANGLPDVGFGTNGVLSYGTLITNYDLTKDANGDFYLCGNKNMNYSLYKFSASGTLDAGFGAGGLYEVDLSGSSDVANSIAFQSDGKLVLSGTSVVGGNSFSAIRINPSGASITTPAAPSDLAASVFKTQSNYVELTWTDNSNNEDGFGIERSTDGQNFTAIDSVGTDIATYQDYAIAPLTTYYYRVFAYNTAGNSAASNEVNVTTDASVGINEADLKNINVYPNPASHSVAIIGTTHSSILVSDISGRVVLKTKLNDIQNTIDISTLPIGTYYLHITTLSSRQTERIVKLQ